MSNAISYKVLPYKISSMKEVSNQDGNFGVVRGYLAAFSRDRGNDVIERGAFQKTIEEHKRRQGRPIRMFLQHDSHKIIGAFPIHLAFEDEKGLFAEGHINLDVQAGREAYSLAKQGVLTDFSIGYMTDDFSFEDDKENPGQTIRKIKSLDLLEASLVSEPMNMDAMMTELKKYNRLHGEMKTATSFEDYPLADRDREWDAEAANRRFREFSDSLESPSSTYKDGFMWYDAENADEFGSYKLQYVDVVDGRLMAIPRAIFAIAGALEGARGGVDLPADDRGRVVSHVVRYYDKMDLEPPFEGNEASDTNNILSEDDMPKSIVDNTILMSDSFTKRDLENVLRESKRFSSRACVTLASALDKIRGDSNVEPSETPSDADAIATSIKELTSIIKNKW